MNNLADNAGVPVQGTNGISGHMLLRLQILGLCLSRNAIVLRFTSHWYLPGDEDMVARA